jgi:hypothetical protein
MNIITDGLANLAAAYADEGKPVTIIAATENNEPRRYFIAIVAADREAIAKALQGAGFDVKTFEVCNKDFVVRVA